MGNAFVFTLHDNSSGFHHYNKRNNQHATNGAAIVPEHSQAALIADA
jgi:hypothetical protein